MMGDESYRAGPNCFQEAKRFHRQVDISSDLILLYPRDAPPPSFPPLPARAPAPRFIPHAHHLHFLLLSCSSHLLHHFPQAPAGMHGSPKI
nr:hypothetical protein Itr_chr15CG16480 [Ipomoea trifida]